MGRMPGESGSLCGQNAWRENEFVSVECLEGVGETVRHRETGV